MTAVAAQPGSLRWEWHEIVPFHRTRTTLGIVVSDESGERSAPIRLTVFAVRTADGWRMRQFHGSIPSGLV